MRCTGCIALHNVQNAWPFALHTPSSQNRPVKPFAARVVGYRRVTTPFLPAVSGCLRDANQRGVASTNITPPAESASNGSAISVLISGTVNAPAARYVLDMIPQQSSNLTMRRSRKVIVTWLFVSLRHAPPIPTRPRIIIGPSNARATFPFCRPPMASAKPSGREARASTLRGTPTIMPTTMRNVRLSKISIARQSTWQVRVKHDGKGSRGIWIMPLMIVAGKRYVES